MQRSEIAEDIDALLKVDDVCGSEKISINGELWICTACTITCSTGLTVAFYGRESNYSVTQRLLL